MILDLDFPPDMRVENEATALIQNDYEVFLLCLDYDNSLPKKEIYKGVHLNRIYKMKKWANRGRGLINTPFNYYTYFWAKHIINFVNEYDINVLHIHDLYMLGAGFIAKKKLKKKIKIVGDLHENYVEGLKHYRFANSFPGNILISIPKWKRKEIEWCNKADYLITVIDEAVGRYKSLGIPEEKITVVANYVNQDEFLKVKDNNKILNKFKSKFIITYIGGFDIHRGIESVVKAMPEVIKECPDSKLILVGKGKNFKELIKLSQNLKVEKYISFEGWQPPYNLPSYIKASNVCLIPHLKTVHTDNTIPHKLFHYMLLEKPVVATNCNPIERIVNETKCGLIYKSGDVKDFADKVIKLYKNEKLRKEMSENGKKAVVEKYNWENTSKNLIELYEKIENELR
ncbi:MAG: glycosyltransferase family 4 protein [Candidatus Cloacimonetes bacterium]|nr:glycosyltransferase family 4 protein [Candidatus Cloacimonadota bacterium]